MARRTASPSTLPEPRAHDGRRLAIVAALLVAAVFVIYGQTLRYGFINYDDPFYVTENVHVSQGLKPREILWSFCNTGCACNWHPLTWVSHMADYQVWRTRGGGHHLTSLLLHAATAVMLLVVLRQATGAFWPSALAAAFFAVHPLRVESVAWIAERKDVLSGLLFMLTLWAYLRYVRRPGARSYLAVLGLFVLGLMAKPMLVTAPFVLLLLDYWPLNRTAGDRAVTLGRLCIEKIPLLLLSVVSSAATFLVQRSAMPNYANFPIAIRTEKAIEAYLWYLRATLWPTNLAALYVKRTQDIRLASVIAAAAVLAAITLAVIAWRRKHPYLIVGWLWFLGMLVPVIGLVQVGSQAMADRYTYLPLLGPTIAVVWLVNRLIPPWRFRTMTSGLAAAGILTVLMGAAWRQASCWKENATLWRRVVDCGPDNAIGNTNLGITLYNSGQKDEGMHYLRRAVELNDNMSEGHTNLAIALADAGQIPEAVAEFRRALELNDDIAETHEHLGRALLRQNKTAEAEKHFRRAVAINPAYADARNSLGQLLADAGKLPEALAQFDAAVRAWPRDAESQGNLANALRLMGRPGDAIPHFEESICLEPAFAAVHTQYGLALRAVGNVAAAIREHQRALELQPDLAAAHLNLAKVLAASGKRREAIGHLEKARPSAAEHAEARYVLAWILATTAPADGGDPARAVKLAEEASKAADDGSPAAWDALAAAYAAVGRFDDALAAVDKAIDGARTAEPALVKEYQSRRKLYEERKPYRE